jgi:hypothetical protein
MLRYSVQYWYVFLYKVFLMDVECSFLTGKLIKVNYSHQINSALLHGRGRMVVGFTTTCAISAHHLLSCEFECHSWEGLLVTTLCDKVCQWLATGQWFSPGTPVFSANKTDHHDITEILLKVVLNTINQPTK